MSELVVNGSWGLGLAMAEQLAHQDLDKKVVISGRPIREVDFAECIEIDYERENLYQTIGEFVLKLPQRVETLTYIASPLLPGHLMDLDAKCIGEAIDREGKGLIYFVKNLLEKQKTLEGLVTIISFYDQAPGRINPVSNFIKSGMVSFSEAISEDGRIGKVMTAEVDSDSHFVFGSDLLAQAILKTRKEAFRSLHERFRPYKISGDSLEVEEVKYDE